jgi:hypothetical protein
MSGILNQRCRFYGLINTTHTYRTRNLELHDIIITKGRKDHVLKTQRFMRSGYLTPLSGDFILHSCVTTHQWYAVNLFLAENCHG